MSETNEKRKHFIRQVIDSDLKNKRYPHIVTRFPPEPNGYLHIGHAKSICLNFGLAEEYQGQCYLRMDDTNPIAEEDEYAKAIIENVAWLGFKWKALTHCSDYYSKLYEFAVKLIKDGFAYVDSLTIEEIRAHRGTLQTKGKASPDRNRSIEENLDLFARMKAGEFPEGTYVLRAKIDMQSGNLNMRDPVIYRIRHATHQRTGNTWCIYPMYDFAHPLSDALEGITHSLCTLEFQDHRPLYDWFIQKLTPDNPPQQIEFARLNVSHTITSKRKLRQLVEEGYVTGWDDPRMPTLQGMRKRGYPPGALRQFCEDIGISKSDSIIDMSLLEDCVRNELNHQAKRAMCVLHPLKIIITNYPENKVERMSAPYHPKDERLGFRELIFTRELYIERDDFMETPPKKYFRLSPGGLVRLRHAYIIQCEKIIKNAQGDVIELHCTYHPDTLGKNLAGQKVPGVIHWVPCDLSIPINIHWYDRLFTVENPGASDQIPEYLNPESYKMLEGCLGEPSLATAKLDEAYQFERIGYFVIRENNAEKKLVVNRIVGLRDTWK